MESDALSNLSDTKNRILNGKGFQYCKTVQQ